MCDFCENTYQNEFRVSVKDEYEDDNLCEFLSPDGMGGYDCEDCDGCDDNNHMFTLSYDHRGINLGYVHKVRGTNIMPFSEDIRINFCPWCGRQIEDDIVEFNEIEHISPLDE